jgi:predicted component of type VI protein secretion system
MDASVNQVGLPFYYRIMAIAPLGAASIGLRHAVESNPLEPGALDRVISAMSPGVIVPLPKEYCPDGLVAIGITGMGDFDPSRMLRSQPYLSALAEALDVARSAHEKGVSHREVEETLDKLLPGNRLDCSPPERQGPGALPCPGGSGIDDLLALVDLGTDDGTPHGKDADTFIPLQRQVEEVIRQVLRRIFSSEEFRQMEAAWRGVALMFESCRREPHAAHPVLFSLASTDLNSLPGVLEELRNPPAPKLPNMVLVDFPLDNSIGAFALLENLLETADSLMLPVASGIGADFLALENWKEIDRRPYLPNYLENVRYSRLKTLRKHPGAPWVTLLANRLVSRPPHTGPLRDTGVTFTESSQLWTSPVWAYGALFALSVMEHAWPVHAGFPDKVSVSGLPLQEDEPIPLETLFSDDRIWQFNKAGITPLSARRHDDAVFLKGLFAMDGSSQEFRLFFGQLVSFLFRLQEAMSTPGFDHELDAIAMALKQFLARGGSPAPEDLQVSQQWVEEARSEVLGIRFTPPKDTGLSDKIELSLRW